MLVGQPASTATCSYELDPDLSLTVVDEGWTQFALENGAPELVPPAPLGRSVLDAISDPTTKLLYREMFTHAATVNRPVSFGIRCDSPEMRRQLLLTITARPAASASTARCDGPAPTPPVSCCVAAAHAIRRS